MGERKHGHGLKVSHIPAQDFGGVGAHAATTTPGHRGAGERWCCCWRDVLVDAGSLETSIWYFLFDGIPLSSDARCWLAARWRATRRRLTLVTWWTPAPSLGDVGLRRRSWPRTKVAESGRLDGKLSDFHKCTIPQSQERAKLSSGAADTKCHALSGRGLCPGGKRTPALGL